MVWRTALLLLALAVAGSHAAEEAPMHPLTNIPPPGEVNVGYFFPEHSDKRFPAGQVIKVVAVVHNDASSPYNISGIIGSLNLVQDFSMHVQNFTAQGYYSVIEAGKEASFEYAFMPDPRLDAREFTVALTMFYEDGKGGRFANTFFNSTINIVEVKKLVDFELLGLFVMLGGIASGVAYLIFQAAAPQLTSMGLMKKKRTSKRTVVADTTNANNDDDWVKGTQYDSFMKKKEKAASATKRK